MTAKQTGTIASGIYAALSLPLVTLAHVTDAARSGILAHLGRPSATALYVLSLAAVYFIGWGIGSIRAIFASINAYGPNWS